MTLKLLRVWCLSLRSALKESGYESDPQLVFRRRPLTDTGTPTADPTDQRTWYRDIQRGGEVPLHGLRKPQPNRPPGMTSPPSHLHI